MLRYVNKITPFMQFSKDKCFYISVGMKKVSYEKVGVKCYS